MVYFQVLSKVIIMLVIFVILDEYHLTLEMKTKKKVISLYIAINILLNKHVLGAALVDVLLGDVNTFWETYI